MAAKEHLSFTWPEDPHIPVWRYLDLSKFVSMLFTDTLFLSRADKLGDIFEGSTPKSHIDEREYIKKFKNTDPNLSIFKDMPDQALINLFDMLKTANENFVKEIFVNCWHMNYHESAAMWSLYSKSCDSVCIQTTFYELKQALPEQLYIGEVKYIDYEKDYINEGNIFNKFIHKRKSFEHEKEIRVVAWNNVGTQLPKEWEISEFGISVPISIENLIQKVYINPTSPPWFKKIVEEVILLKKKNIKVEQSLLSATPLY